MISPIIKPKPLNTCASCKHFDPVPDDPGSRGMCHRYPPTVYGFTVHMKLPTGQVQEVGQNNTAWPVLSSDQWCGEHTTNLLRTEMN